jgi:hypothetical protein
MGATFSASATAFSPIDSSQRQWLRKVSFVVGDSSGNALDLSALQIRFTVASAVIQTPRLLEARIYNLSDQTTSTIQQEFTRVQLSAGYQDGPFGLIFSGTICNFRRGKESTVDSYLDLVATDGDAAYNQSTVSQSLAAGWTPADVQKTLVQSMKGIMLGNSPELATTQAPRGKVLYGMTRDHLRQFGDANNLDWSIENGQINFVPRGPGYIPGEAIVLSSGTGMIGIPEQTIDGVNVRTLLNPNIRTGRVLQIDNSSIASTQFNQTVGTDVSRLPDLSRDGLYKVYSLRHTGELRSQAWYTDAICEAVDPTGGIAVSSPTYINAVVNGQ